MTIPSRILITLATTDMTWAVVIGSAGGGACSSIVKILETVVRRWQGRGDRNRSAEAGSLSVLCHELVNIA